MYFVKRAFKYLKNKMGRTLLLGIIFLVIANFVLAGLLVQNASKQAQIDTRERIGADVNYVMDYEALWYDVERGVVSDTQIVTRLKSIMAGSGILSNEVLTSNGAPTYANFMQVVDSNYVKSYDFGLSFNVYSEDLRQYVLDTTAQRSAISTFELKSYASEEPNDFIDGDTELLEGRYATRQEIDSGAGVVLIEENVAQMNNLKTGDTVSVMVSILDYENVAVDYEVIGIYRTNEEINPKASLPQNRFYVPFKSLSSIGLTRQEMNNTLVSPNVISLYDPMETDSFKAEAEGKINFKYGTLDANDDLYERLTGPLETLGDISAILVIMIAAAGALIIGLITALTVNERKEEIGVLLAVGERKLKIVSQFILEVTVIALLAFILSTFTGSYIGENISDVLLESDIVQSQATNEEFYGKNGYYGKDGGKIDVDEAEVNINLDTVALLQLFGMGLVLSAVSTMVPSLYVMRFNPKQILTNTN